MSLFDDFNRRYDAPSLVPSYAAPVQAAPEAAVVRVLPSKRARAARRSPPAHPDARAWDEAEPRAPPQIESAFVPVASIDEAAPMFALSKVQFTPSGTIMHMVVRNDIIAVALDNNHVLRIDLSNPKDIEGVSGAA